MGYDFMIDIYNKPWLIEVNTNPCLEETSKLLKMLLPRMLDDAFKLTLDQQFPYPEGADHTTKQSFPVEGYTDLENMWQNVYQMKP